MLHVSVSEKQDKPTSLSTRTYLLVFLLLTVAVVLRFYDVTDRGLFQSDEGYYLLAARTERAALDWAVKRGLGLTDESIREALLRDGGTNPTAAKPGYHGLMVVTSILVGMQDYTGLAVSAVSGALTIVVVFCIGKMLYDDLTGLTAAAFLAVSNYHVTFSRSGLPGTTSVFFVMLGFLFYLQSTRQARLANRWLFLAGFNIGYAFTCHYNLFYVPLVFGVFELVHCCKARALSSSKDRERAVKVRRLFLFSLSMLCPLLFFEAIYRPAKMLIYALGMGDILAQTAFGQFFSYFEQIWHQIGPVAQSGAVARDLLFYPRLVVYFDGYLVLLLFLIGLVVSLRNHRESSPGEQIALSLFFVAVLFWTLVSPLQFGRAFLLVTPLLALFSARGAVWLAGRKRALALGLAVLVMGYGMYHALPTLHMRSGYREAIAYMQAHQGVKHISSVVTVSRTYVGVWNAQHLVPLAEAQELYDQGFRYLLLDQDRYISRGELVERAGSLEPVFETAHSTDAFLYEDFTDEIRDRIRREPKVLRVYELAPLLY